MDTLRVFWRHETYKELWAVETTEDGLPIGGLRCTKPEEQTAGALPVLALDASPETIEFLEDNKADFSVWTPPAVPEHLMQAIVAAERDCQEKEATFERKNADAKAAKNLHEKAVGELRRLVREAAAQQPSLFTEAHA